MRAYVLPAIVVMVLCCTLFAPQCAAADPSSGPAAVVERFHGALVQLMTRAGTLCFKDRVARIEPTFQNCFATRWMAEKSVGRYWKSLTNDEQQALVRKYAEWSVAQYADNFDGYSGEQFQTLSQSEWPDGTALVVSRLSVPDGDTVDFYYRLQKQQRWRVVDIQIEGVSQLALARSQYLPVIKKKGIGELLTLLQQKIDELGRDAAPCRRAADDRPGDTAAGTSPETPVPAQPAPEPAAVTPPPTQAAAPLPPAQTQTAADATVPAADVAPTTTAPKSGPQDDNFDDMDDVFALEDGQSYAADQQAIADPLEIWNRLMFSLNDTFYFRAYRPVARGYCRIVPEPVRRGLRNALDNIAMPIRLVNCLLQGDMQGARTEFYRFCVNTTMGVLGFLDAAQSRYALEKQQEDLGQTLGTYGIGGGLYVVWPFLGPSTLRDSIGTAGDSFFDPWGYLVDSTAQYSITAFDYLNDNSFRLGDYEALKRGSLDPYIALRSAYVQNRRSLIQK